MDIDKMKAGPELDLLVAEKAMGWEWNTDNSLQSIMFAPNGLVAAAKFHEGSVGYEEGEGPHVLAIPPFSFLIEYAWKVVNRMRELDFIFSSHNWLTSSDWSATFQDARQVKTTITDDTAPLAICRAALKAVET